MNHELSAEDAWHARKCDGYIDLKMWDAARAELEALTEPARCSLTCRVLELQLTMGEEHWAAAETIARELREREPEEPAFWVQLAFVTRRLRTIEDARAILRVAREKFPAEPVIPFNLACYACQLGERQLARTYLAEAEAMEPDYRAIALEDDDLRPLWDELSP